MFYVLLWFLAFSAVMLGVAISALLLADYVRRKLDPDRKKWERWQRGECPRCGYDLRSSPQICPECGRKNQWTDVPDFKPLDR